MIRQSLIAASALTVLLSAGTLIGCDKNPEQTSAESAATPSASASGHEHAGGEAAHGSDNKHGSDKKMKNMDMHADGSDSVRANFTHKELVVLDDVTAVPDEFQTALGQMRAQYQKIAQAFVADDAKAADAAAQKLSEQVENLDSVALDAQSKSAWQGQRKLLLTSLAGLSDADGIQAKRAQFSGVSEAMYSALKSFGGPEQSLHVAFCPMAMNGEGAYWLADKREIENPYMGQKMARCGEVKETL